MMSRPTCLRLLKSITLSFSAAALLVPSSSALAQPTEQKQTKVDRPQTRPSADDESGRAPVRGVSPRPSEIEALVVYAHSAPAEYAADALIRIAESPRVVDREWKRELLEEAFRRASGAQYPLRRGYVGGNVDTRPGYLSYAYDLRLDALSLQCRAIKAMLSVDRARARALFSEISPRLKLEPLGCEDALVYDVKEFYGILAEIIQTAFSPEERRQDQHIQFMASYIDGITSSAQVGPVAKAVLAIKPAASQLPLLIYSFGNALKNIPADDRSFTHVMLRDSASRSIIELAETGKRMDVPVGALLKAYRAYLVTNLSAARCGDNLSGGVRDYMQKMITALNRSLWPESPISDEEGYPARVLGEAQVVEYWNTPKAKRMLMGAKSLRFAAGTTRLSDAEKQTPGWQTKLAEFLNEMESWNVQTEKTEADYFHQKSNLYAALVDIVPDGPARDNVIESFIEFLRDNYVQRESRMEWLWQANHLVGLARSERVKGAAKILEKLSNSGDMNLRLYADLARLSAAPQN